eukprot:751335-Hanusia_phi.AAC.6
MMASTTARMKRSRCAGQGGVGGLRVANAAIAARFASLHGCGVWIPDWMPAEGRHALPTRMKGLPLLLLLKFLVPSAQVAHDASEVQYLLNMAGLAASQKQYGKAAMNYKRAASLMGKVVNMQLQLRMGDMFMFTGDFEDARRAYQVPFMIDRSQSRMSVEEWIDVGGRMALAAELTNQTRAAISILEKIVIAHFTSTNTTNYPLLIFFHLFDLLNSHSDCKMG